MSTDRGFKEFDRHLQPRERCFPVLELRRRTSDHPMVMFAVIVAAAFASMALVPTSGAAFASVGGSTPFAPRTSSEPYTTAKADRLSRIDIACTGQAWGAESEACLVAIARQAGKDEIVAIRVVALVEPQAPTIF
jgi:hypothetical protein